MRTLVLDMGYQPINAVPFTRAMTYLVKGKVEMLSAYDQPIHPDWQAPAVVRLLHLIRPYTHQIKFSRQNVLARDRWQCQYCGERMPTRELTFDHVVPRAQGGLTVWENIVMACVGCNARKADRTPAQAGMTLHKRPMRPTWLPVFNMALAEIVTIPPQWREYWSTELLP